MVDPSHFPTTNIVQSLASPHAIKKWLKIQPFWPQQQFVAFPDKDAESDLSLTKNYCITANMQKNASSIHKFLLMIQQTLGTRAYGVFILQHSRKEIAIPAVCSYNNVHNILRYFQGCTWDDNFVSTGKNLLKNRNQTFLVVHYFICCEWLSLETFLLLTHSRHLQI